MHRARRHCYKWLRMHPDGAEREERPLEQRVERLDFAMPGDAARVLDLQKRAYRVEADLIGFDGIPPLHESLEEMLSRPLAWIGIRDGGQIVAALAYQHIDGVCDIDRLVVDPDHFGRGYGTALITALLDHPHIIVSTGSANLPARRLYEKHGFQALGEAGIAPDVSVTRYERRAAPSG